MGGVEKVENRDCSADTMVRGDLEKSGNSGGISISDVDLLTVAGASEGREGVDLPFENNLPVLPVRCRYSSAC